MRPPYKTRYCTRCFCHHPGSTPERHPTLRKRRYRSGGGVLPPPPGRAGVRACSPSPHGMMEVVPGMSPSHRSDNARRHHNRSRADLPTSPPVWSAAAMLPRQPCSLLPDTGQRRSLTRGSGRDLHYPPPQRITHNDDAYPRAGQAGVGAYLITAHQSSLHEHTPRGHRGSSSQPESLLSLQPDR
ncbi:MAG: hypothetical protein KatS3mg056_3822 [Chloroflexus sp.]|nr:MAG: hypothetical protein KatS3mg056_3822 [Chloroflexus sp.]